MTISGKAWKYGDDINTDYIFPGSYTYVMMSEAEMGGHAMEGIDPVFASSAAAGDVIAAGKNWGCGSSREQAVKCLKARGIGAVVAGSVARIYFRNAINEGFPVIVCPAAAETTKPGETLTIDLERGTVKNASGEYFFPPMSDYIRELLACGGLLPYIKDRLKREGKIK